MSKTPIFDELWQSFNDQLLKYIMSKVNDVKDAEDILQNVFIKLYKNLDDLKDLSKVQSWLYRVTKHAIIDYYRKTKPVVVESQVFDSLESETVDDDNMNAEIGLCLKEMLETLPDKYRVVYDMYENQQYKHKEIADELDISVSTSKVRLKRAKDLFKVMLITCCDFETDVYGNIINYSKIGTCESCSCDD